MSGTESEEPRQEAQAGVQVVGRHVICNLFPGGNLNRFTTYLEELSDGRWRFLHEHKSAWGSTITTIPLRKEDMCGLKQLMTTLKV